jgi:hypothetical protein
VIDIGGRLKKMTSDIHSLLERSDKSLSKLVSQVEKNNVI